MHDENDTRAAILAECARLRAEGAARDRAERLRAAERAMLDALATAERELRRHDRAATADQLAEAIYGYLAETVDSYLAEVSHA